MYLYKWIKCEKKFIKWPHICLLIKISKVLIMQIVNSKKLNLYNITNKFTDEWNILWNDTELEDRVVI
jgi:hypothetical protein